MVRRVSALSQVLKETQANNQQDTAREQSDNTTLPKSDKATLPQSNITALSQNLITPISQNDTLTLPQYHNTEKQQSEERPKPQRTRKTDERDKVTYYLEPGQLDKLDDLRTAYRKATHKRLSEQDFMRLIIDRLDLKILL